MIRAILLLITAILLAACSSVDGVGRYRVQSVGNAQRTVLAKVLSTSPVYIQEGTSGVGAGLGGTVGGGIAAENSDNAAVIIAGVIVGAVVGAYIEGKANVRNATEYLLETDRGVLLTVAQVNSGQYVFATGDKVALVYGYPNRLIPAPK